jgi:hypothetical protein
MEGLELSLGFCTFQIWLKPDIYVSKMSDAGVHIIFEKETCKMVQGAMVLMRGVWIGTLYKLLGSTINDGCNSFVVPKDRNEEDMTPKSNKKQIYASLLTWLVLHIINDYLIYKQLNNEY